ncbi:tape measure protein [Salmonella enterica subsp. enterica serovar Montevideo]|uniref:Tape measure protein N-terminal domain-containing protein n=1 Tax=Salmonella muenster TaxID=82689 RepID=A0A5X5CJG9_SALMS|nr:tape measure protein [Salmonella enterica subsp. enterica serovar Montevideo]EBO2418103.1 tape measure protein [Salmonella enterica subsp. enterica serovar Muenster]ECK2029365.1 tape measure protein [Salmonella enterica]ECZ0218153.1 tape measure protein [Salmonella enterica subsp. enterica]EIS3536603.1 tape measure protein [Salmonella enterica subsp. enterica serovar Muenchen]EJO8712406.1 tape measure protein [Salmonella enterica subsp. enterica serovar Newport]
MTGKRLKASVIIDLNGNLSRRSRQYSNQINALSRSGQSSLRALRMEVVRVSGAIDRMGSLSTRTFRMLSAGALGIAGVGYTANKLFIGAAAQREQQIIAMNSLYYGDKVRAQAMMAWAKQNAKDTTWGLSGVLDEIRSSKGFGMTDEQTKQFITMLQDQGAMHGWDLPTAQGASLQLKQMFARQQITAADANLLTGYGINVYQALADATGTDVKKIRDLGTKGKLGMKSILTVFRTLSEQSKGAQASAMNSWDGMFAQMEANLLEFRIKVANSGPFEEIKNEMRRVLNWHDMADKSGELDALAENIGQKFLTTFRTVKIAAQELWRWLKPGKDALAWVDQNIVSLKKLAAVLVSVWLANKALRAGWAVAKPSWQVASYPFKTGRRMWRWMRNRKRGQAGLPVPDAMTSETLLQGIGIQRVFVINWPRGFGGYGSGGGRRVRSGGRMAPLLPRQPLLLSGPQPLALPAPRPVLALPPPGVPVTARPAPLPLPGKSGLLSRLAGSAAGQLVTGTVGKLADAGRAVGGWFSGIGNKLAGSAIGRVVTKGAGALGWMGKGAGRALSRLGGPVMGALQLAPVLMDEQASTHEKAGAIGSTAGAWLGGAVGSLAGPLGTVAGATLGSVAGEYLGGFVTDLYQKWTAPDKEPQEQKVNAEASLRVELGEGLRLTSSRVTEDGMGLNIYAGDNYITGW